MKTEAAYHWTINDGIVTLADDRELSEKESLIFLLEQADAPATTYVHKSFTAEGLASQVRRWIWEDGYEG